MGVSANTLFHFTENKEYLKGILANKFFPKYCLEDLSNAIPGSSIYTAQIPMVCFCDLLFSQIKDHIDFYGDYGIGLRKKEWGLKNGICPIVYIPNESISALLIQKITTQIRSLLNNEKKNISLGKQLPDFYKYLKPYEGKAKNKKTNKMVDKIFYDEREWRYVPEGFSVLPEDIDKSLLNKENIKMKKNSRLQFSAIDIKYIIVKEEGEIPEFVSYIENHFKNIFNKNERQLLMSKLISVEQIRDDI
jgi:hypothetical protein